MKRLKINAHPVKTDAPCEESNDEGDPDDGPTRIALRCGHAGTTVGSRTSTGGTGASKKKSVPGTAMTQSHVGMRPNQCITNWIVEHVAHAPSYVVDTCLSSKVFSMLAGFGLCHRSNMSAAMLDINQCERARVRRDRRFDGMFFTGVRTTRIYCRPVCPVKPARAANVTFYPSAAAAELAGFRPCLRCRPEAAPFSPAWMGTRTTV